MRGPFDAVVMNPPFSLPKQPHADVEHVTHAMQFLRPGGVLVAVVAGGVLFRSTKVVVTFRETVAAAGGTIEPLPEGTFKASGTGVNTALVTFTRRS
jgi:16S rRNA G1207 methylase RsmC